MAWLYRLEGRVWWVSRHCLVWFESQVGQPPIPEAATRSKPQTIQAVTFSLFHKMHIDVLNLSRELFVRALVRQYRPPSVAPPTIALQQYSTIALQHYRETGSNTHFSVFTCHLDPDRLVIKFVIVKDHDKGPRINDEELRVKDQGRGIKDQGSRMRN